jgi:hypothetical protein
MERTRLDAAELMAHAAWVRRVAHALARDADEADELVQETWTTALQRSLPAPSLSEHLPHEPARATQAHVGDARGRRRRHMHVGAVDHKRRPDAR